MEPQHYPVVAAVAARCFGRDQKRGGLEPFREIGRTGPLPLGSARVTAAGRLPFKGIIHVAGIDGLWRASEGSIRGSVGSAVQLAEESEFSSLAFPIIGAGAGGMGEEKALGLMQEEFGLLQNALRVVVVRFDG